MPVYDDLKRTKRNTRKWIDISVSLRNGMAQWPGNPPVRIERVLDVELGDSHTLSEITMGSHTGTHIDAPLHFIKGGAGINDMPVDILIGRARVLEIHDTESIKPGDLVQHRIRRGECILFKTRNSYHVWQTGKFEENFVFISLEAAQFLVDRKVRAVGIDYLSVGGYKRDGSQTHKILLGAGVWIIEGLDLLQVAPGKYDFICLPLKLGQGDGAPARAMLKPVGMAAVKRK